MSDPNDICAFCKQPLFLNDDTLVLFCGGARIDAPLKQKSNASAFMDISWRSPYRNGEGGALKNVAICESPKDQFQVKYCSSLCLRAYFNAHIDSLENEINSWYHERIRGLLKESGRAAAVDEWRRYFGCSTKEAEEEVDRAIG